MAITSKMVEHINDKIKTLANSGSSDQTWGFDTAGTGGSAFDPDSFGAARDGLFVVLLNVNTESANATNIIAASTRIPANYITVSGKQITIQNVPYTETIATVNTSTSVAGFAIVEGKTINSTFVDIVGSDGTQVKKAILDTSQPVDFLFIGAISGGQTIGQNNSFALTNINISFT